MSALAFLHLLEDLDRNDIFSLPEVQTSIVPSLPRLESIYDIFLYLKVGDKEIHLHRESDHDLFQSLHKRLKKEWSNQPPQTRATSGPV